MPLFLTLLTVGLHVAGAGSHTLARNLLAILKKFRVVIAPSLVGFIPAPSPAFGIGAGLGILATRIRIE